MSTARSVWFSRCASALVAVCLPWMLAATAHARPCQNAADCPAQFSCVSVGQTACAASCTGSDCEAGPACAASDIKVCRSAQCRSDVECPNGMFCYYTAAGTGCLPRYVPPCASARDCGEGFECLEISADSCIDGGAAGHAADARANCTGRPTGVFRCTLKELGCSATEDCPADFSCVPRPSSAGCTDSEDAGATADVAASCTDAGSTNNTCLPPYASVDFDAPRLGATSRDRGWRGSAWHEPSARGGFRDGCSLTGPVRGAPSNGLPVAVGLVMLGIRSLRQRRRCALATGLR